MLTLGIFPYFNTLPLTHFLASTCVAYRAQSAPPSHTAAWVRSGCVDAALVPTIEVLESPELEAFADIGICANGPVASVLLRCRKPLGAIRSLCQDPASRTSNRLARILWHRAWGHHHPPILTPDAARADAEIIIGDRALCAPAHDHTYDLAEAWHDATGLPFVFAVWACHKDYPNREALADCLRRSLAMGLRHLGQLAQEQAASRGWDLTLCRRYLTEHLHYDIGPRERQAMALFGAWAQELSDTPGAITEKKKGSSCQIIKPAPVRPPLYA